MDRLRLLRSPEWLQGPASKLVHRFAILSVEQVDFATKAPNPYCMGMRR